MRIAEWNLHMNGGRKEGLPLFALFGVGFAAGIFIMNTGKGILLENTGLLDEKTLYHMKYMAVNSNALFYFVLRQRLGALALMAVFSTTYLGLAICMGTALWYGASGGIFVSALLLRYGLKGALFLPAGLLPQWLLYLPAFVLLLRWCERVCRSIYFRRGISPESKKPPAGRLLELGVIILLLLAGCVLESYVNPYLLGGLLKIF